MEGRPLIPWNRNSLKSCRLCAYEPVCLKEMWQNVSVFQLRAVLITKQDAGRRTPDIFILYRFSQLYQVTMEYLLSASNPQPPQHLPSSLRSLSDEDLASLHLYLDYLAYRRTHIPSNEKEAPNN